MNGEGPTSSSTTHFGFRTVAETEKAGLVRGVFDTVAPKYDLMNDLMSGGLHRLWKARLVDVLAPRPGQAIVDVAGGTGDVATRILDKMTRGTGGDPPNPVTVCDINAEMLNHGRDRAIDGGHLTGLTWVCGDAEALPFPDMSFDAYTIAFGLRNVTHIERALAEARRVLKPGGRFLCMEFSRVVVPVLDKLYDTYSFRVLPWLGQTVAGNRDAYVYLAESIRRFPDQGRLAALMGEAGFHQVSFRNLSGGVTAIHSGWRV
ncbi:MAG: bifunctional demethylmenaquinone methyltransferase/2-methoxy-6-polyprenyl-1,4-benzoquinol methylase UbiE [Rhodospirillaceae bacterium]|nr:MAG: bifunctional demethylmenaquinone methyltransferase/2-methoxy-6-polyprenyl-1,4-benzoquinol methylase UbiE [Rhodospirillaceae bacterium]